MAPKDKKSNPSLKASQFIPAGMMSQLAKMPRVFYWRIALGVLSILCLILVACVWLSGSEETREAFSEGRRLLIRLDNGDIQGKMASTESPVAAAKPADTSQPAATLTPTPEPEQVTHVETPTTPPAEEIVKLPPSLPSLDNSPIVPAQVPLPDTNPGLSEKTPDGQVPIIGKDGTKPWRYYSKPYERKGSLPMIAIIVTGLGEGKAVSESAMKLPENFSLSFSPYAKDLGNWMKTAHITGHEAFLDLPMQPSNYPASDPGAYGLLVTKEPNETTKRLQWLMARTQGYAGFVTPQNESFSSNPEAFKGLLQTFSDRGLLLVVGHEPVKAETKQALETGTTPTITADTLIDEDLSATAIQARLTSLEQTAKTRGYAIGIANAYPVTIQQLNAWAAKLPEQGFVLVPVTFIVHLRFS